MSEAIKIILVILISSVKFLAAPPFAVYFNPSVNFSYLEIVTYCIIGGMLGVYVFTYFSPYVFSFWEFLKQSVTAPFQKKKYFDAPTVDTVDSLEVKYEYVETEKRKKLFTPHNRRIVMIWNKYGLPGLAFLSPVLISIPIGAVIAAHYVHNKKKLFLYMFIAITFWSLVLNSFWRWGASSKINPETTQSIINK